MSYFLLAVFYGIRKCIDFCGSASFSRSGGVLVHKGGRAEARNRVQTVVGTTETALREADRLW